MPYLCLFSSHLLELDTSCIFGELHLELAWSMLMIFTARIMHMCYERMWPTYRYIHALYISAAIFSHYWLVWVSLRLAPISKYAFKSLQVAKCIFIAVWKVFTFWCSNRHTLAYSLTKEYCKPAEANDVPHTWNFRQAPCPFVLYVAKMFTNAVKVAIFSI